MPLDLSFFRTIGERNFGQSKLLFNFEGSWEKDFQNEGKRKRTGRSPRYGGVAQLGEHLLCTQGVRSSNLLISTRGFPEEGEPRSIGEGEEAPKATGWAHSSGG